MYNMFLFISLRLSVFPNIIKQVEVVITFQSVWNLKGF